MATTTAEAPRPPTPPARRRNGAGTAALVIGTVSLVLAILIVFFWLAGPLGLIAAIFGLVGMGRARRGEADNRRQAVAGLIMGLIALVIAVVIGIRISAFVVGNQGAFSDFWRCITNAPTEAEQNRCGRDLANELEQ